MYALLVTNVNGEVEITFPIYATSVSRRVYENVFLSPATPWVRLTGLFIRPRRPSNRSQTVYSFVSCSDIHRHRIFFYLSHLGF
jgi:hypothetical protein